MLTYKDLVNLEHALRGQTVLSVYVNGEGTDPATRNRWHAELRHSFDDIASWLRKSSHAEREAFATCRAMALKHLDRFPAGIGSPGWTGFFTTNGAYHIGAVPVPVPTMAIWSTGACVAPYIRVIREERRVLVSIVDSKQVRIYQYLDRSVQLLETVRPYVTLEPPSHLGRPPRTGFHTGTRGRTGTDAAQRELQKGTELMLADAAGRIAALAAGGAWIVIGGIPGVAAATLARLAPGLAARAMQAGHLDVHATEAQVAECARVSASHLRDADDLRRIEETISAFESNGAGVTGAVDTRRALDEARVRELLFTLRYLKDHAADAEAAVRRAFDEGAVVEHVSGEAATRLDRVGGIAARLRYVPPRETLAQSEPGSLELPP